MQTYVNLIRTFLNNPENVASLLDSSATSISPDNGFFQLLRMPLFYPQELSRGSFSVIFKDGLRFFLKINCFTQKIQTEINVSKILRHYQQDSFYHSAVLDYEPSLFLGKDRVCAWVLTEWVLGKPVRLNDTGELNMTAKALVNLHRLPIDLNELELLFGVKLPPPAVLLSASRRHMIEDIEQALTISTLDFGRELELAARVLLDNQSTTCFSLNHGDFHVNNVLLVQKKDRYILTFIDWEDALLESPLHDLAHFFFMSGMEASQTFARAYSEVADRRLLDEIRGSEISLSWAMVSVFCARALRWKNKRDPDNCAFFCEELRHLIREVRASIQEGLIF